MVKIVPSHPHLVVDYQDEILESVDDADVSIRMRALELTSAMVSRCRCVLVPAAATHRPFLPFRSINTTFERS